MRRKKVFLSLAMAISLALSAVTFASAADYRFSGTEETEYYPDTSYEVQYRAEYKYGGTNLIDYEIPELPYGSKYNVEVGAMQKVGYPSERIMNLTGAEDISSKLLPRIAEPAVFTNTAGMYLADGTIGEIAIPVLGISFKVREGETSSNMSKGFAHYSSTSAWDGNVGVCGHNRGTKFAIGNVKDLNKGDLIAYTTVYGTRIYAVEEVKIIGSTDWSYLTPCFENRLTITTCLAGKPDVRVCVRAIGLN
ncbi:MAG: sortase [Firmicutes bacterium]|nr:sortase [Bacillota bacterium]